MSSGGDAVGSREKAAQLGRHAVACRRLHARDERQWNYGPDDGGSSGDVRTHATRGLGRFQIPNGGLVGGFLLPPAEADAARTAGRRAACQAAAAVGLARAAVEPDYITHTAVGDAFRDTRPRQQRAQGFGTGRRGARLEPRKHLVDEFVVVVDRDAVTATGHLVADAIHEGVLGTRAFDLRLREDHDSFAFGDRRRELARLFDAGLHATADEHHSETRKGHSKCVHVRLPEDAGFLDRRGKYATLQHLPFVTGSNTSWFPFTWVNPDSVEGAYAPVAEKDSSAG